jgi:hypothetical protein
VKQHNRLSHATFGEYTDDQQIVPIQSDGIRRTKRRIGTRQPGHLFEHHLTR